MKILRLLGAIFTTFLLLISVILNANAASGLKLIQKIPLPHVAGRIDHMSIDVKGMRLFMASLGNNTVEVIDIKSGKQTNSMSGFSEPQGIRYVAEGNKIYVANGGSGECDIIDGGSFKLIKKINFSGDADNVRYDPFNKKVYVGYGAGAIGIINGINDEQIGEVKLSGHPEAFALDIKNNRIYLNVPAIKAVAVINSKERKIESELSLNGTSGNFPIALDTVSFRLFVGCRNPAKLLVFDTRSEKLIQTVDIDGDTDDLFYDAENKRIYVSCGQGFIDVIQESDNSGYKVLERIPTAAGARTSFFAAELSRLYLAVPARGERSAEILVYQTDFH